MSDYQVIGFSRGTRLMKGDDYHEILITVKNTSDYSWWDGRHGSEGREHCVRVAPALHEPLDQRYFELLSLGYYGENTLFKHVFRKSRADTRDLRTVEPGETAIIRVFIKVKDYTPVGEHHVAIGLQDRHSKIKLQFAKRSKRFKVKVGTPEYHDGRMETLRDIGEVDFIYANSAFEKHTSDKDQAVVMAVWKRISRLGLSIEAFEKQIGVNPVLFLWVNNRERDDEIKAIIDNAELPIKVYFSKHNIGGYGRFYLSKELVDDYESVIYIDDDQIPAPEAFATMAQEHRPKTIAGVYATQLPSRQDYWLRREIKPGEAADYIGTRGMICDTSIFRDEGIFDCPKKYWFIEDLWLCYYANTTHDWALQKSAAHIDTFEDKKDQFRPMIDLKNEFYKYLLKRGLRIHEQTK